MNTADLIPGTGVQVTTSREIAGRSWQGSLGTVWGEYRRGEVADWCLVQIAYDGTVIVGFAPDELDLA